MGKVRVKPSKSQSLVGMIVGIIFVIIGFSTVLPLFGPFGIIWTLIAVLIAGYHVYNFFSNKGISTWEVDIESNKEQDKPSDDFDSKLRKLTKLKEDGIISEDEFQIKKNEFMNKEW